MSQFSPSNEFRPSLNRFGFFGFIVSILGLVCTLGVLCPIGFLLSLVGLRKNPRGFALAGTIIGGLGTMMCLVILVGGFIVLAAVGIAAGAVKEAVKKGAPYVKSVADGASLYHQVELYKTAHNAAPSSLEDLNIDSAALIDGWGHRFHYQLNADGSFTITSDGPDGRQGTIDDIRCTSDSVGPRKFRSKRHRDTV